MSPNDKPWGGTCVRTRKARPTESMPGMGELRQALSIGSRAIKASIVVVNNMLSEANSTRRRDLSTRRSLGTGQMAILYIHFLQLRIVARDIARRASRPAATRSAGPLPVARISDSTRTATARSCQVHDDITPSRRCSGHRPRGEEVEIWSSDAITKSTSSNDR